MIDELRKLGLIVEVEDGCLVLRSSVTVCAKDVPLTPEQARLLVKLDSKIINFKINLEAMWTNNTFKEL